MCRYREILVVYASLARKSFHLWKNFNFSRKNRVFESDSIQDIKKKKKRKEYYSYLFYLGTMFNCSFLIGGTFTYDQYATLERSISKFLIFLHFESGQLDIGHRTTSPLRLSMSSCPSKINERLLILVVRSTSLQPRVDFFSSQIAHQVVHKLLANDNNNTRNREPRL